MVLLRCVDVREAEQMLIEVHEGSFGTHANGHAMARKILRAGYYWLTMESIVASMRGNAISVRPSPIMLMLHPYL